MTAPFSPGARVIVPRFAHGHPAVGEVEHRIGVAIKVRMTDGGEAWLGPGAKVELAPENLALFRRRVVATQSTGDAA